VGTNAPVVVARRPRVEVRLAGAFAVSRDGTELAAGQIGSRKSRMLLKLLAASRPALVTADQIAEVLWDGAPPDGADRNIASLISRLRAVLGPGVIQGGRAGYRLGDGTQVSVDLDIAGQLCDHAERTLAGTPTVALAAAERASDLLSAGMAFADEPHARWADPARDLLRDLLRRARLTAAEAALATGQAGLAMRYAEAAMAADTLDEAAHRWYMSAAVAAGEQAKALLAYARLSEHLSAELGADPAPQTRDLHVAILREDAQLSASNGGRAAPPAAPRPRPELIGRAAGIGALRAAWSRAAGRQPGLVLIVGEAGIGKTTLAEFIAAEAEQSGATVLRSRCYETERSLFLQPIVEALTPAVGRLSAARLREILGRHAAAAAALLPTVADVLGPASSGRESVEMGRRHAFEAVTALLRGLASQTPVLVVIDDLQYAGQSTVELLHFLGRQVTDSRLLTLVTVRAEQMAEIGAALEPVADRVDVGPLAPTAVQLLAQDAGQGAFAADILQRTRGHTLFVVEVLRALRGGDAGVPESLRSAVQARVRSAGAPVETLLRAAAVVGAALDPLTLGALLDLAPAAAVDLCEQGLRAKLLIVSGRHYEFANDLIREVLYATTPEPTRLAYHRRAADLLTAQPEALAEHAAASGDWRRAARALLVAAEDALRRYAASDAVALATRALDAADRASDDELRARALVLRGRAREVVGAHAEALPDLTEGARTAHAIGDRRLEMLALRGLGGDVPVSRGLPIGYASVNLEQGLRIAESLGDRAMQADLLSRLAIIATNRLQLDTGLEQGARAVAAGRASGDEQALVMGLDGLKIACLCVGDLRGLRDALTELDPLVRRHGDMLRLQWAEFESAFLHIAACDWDRAATAIHAAIEINQRGAHPHCESWYTTHLASLARLRGRDEEAETLARRAVDLSEQYEHDWWQAAASATLGESLLLRGDRPGAVELLERGTAAARRAGMEAYLLRCLAPLAAATGSRPVLGEAAEILDHASIPTDRAWMLGYEAYLWIARAWLTHDEPQQARSYLAPLLTVAEREPWTAALAEALVVDSNALTRLGLRKEATARLKRAAQLARQHGLPHVLDDADAALRLLS
jgi:DNA-binding SARP family transcriptional activator